MPRGRPKAPPGTQREMVVRFRLTAEEYQKLQAEAVKMHLSPGELARIRSQHRCFTCGRVVDDSAPVQIWTPTEGPDIYYLCSTCHADEASRTKVAQLLSEQHPTRHIEWDGKPIERATQQNLLQLIQEGGRGRLW